MANPHFQFKKFTVHHDKCAMKVGTDGILVGVWTNVSNSLSVLDIGTGSGLIALMLCQRSRQLNIDAIDIDLDAATQATENIMASPFSNQINVIHSCLQSYTDSCLKKYDLIVSNPPFFADSLKSPIPKRSIARHTETLQIDDLLFYSSRLLNENGRISLIYPFDYKVQIAQLALSNSLHITRLTNVHPTPSSKAKRILIELSKKECETETNDLTIEKERHRYTEEFTALVRDFYLKL